MPVGCILHLEGACRGVCSCADLEEVGCTLLKGAYRSCAAKSWPYHRLLYSSMERNRDQEASCRCSGHNRRFLTSGRPAPVSGNGIKPYGGHEPVGYSGCLLLELFIFNLYNVLQNPRQQKTFMLDQLTALLRSFRFRFATEKDLQDGIEAALKDANIQYAREYPLNKSDRPDFMIGGIAVEVKTKGSLSDLLRQASRYAACNEVIAVLVIGTPRWLPRVPAELGGKPLRSVRLIGSLL